MHCRMVNSGHAPTLEVAITNQNEFTQTDGCEVWEIAFDGLYLDQPKRPRQGKTFIPTGGRADWTVVCNKPGTYEVS